MKKKLLVSVLSICTLLFFSCSDENDSVLDITEAGIVGDWNLTGFNLKDGETSITLNGVTSISTFEAVGKDYDLELSFGLNPKTFTAEGSYNLVFTITTMGETTTQEQEGEDIFDASEWRLAGNTLLFGSGDDETGFVITSLSDTEMILESELNDSSEFSGTMIETKLKYLVRLTR